MLSYGDVEGGIEHLANAVAVCGQPAQLLQVLQKTLPPQVFHLLVQRLPLVSQVKLYIAIYSQYKQLYNKLLFNNYILWLFFKVR